MQRILDHEVETAASESIQTRTGLTSGDYGFSLIGERFWMGGPAIYWGLSQSGKRKI